MQSSESQRRAVARAICHACEENPDHQGDTNGNPYRWQDYLPVADAAIQAMLSAEPAGAVEYEVQIADNRSCIWIHATDGSTVGRFGRNGIDLHRTITEQIEGAAQCRLCTHEPVTQADWVLFRAKALEWWGVVVPDDAFDAALFAKGRHQR